MPKNNATKTRENPKKIDNEKKQENQEKPREIKWEELDKYVGKPVWENKEKRWRILDGYKRKNKRLSVSFSDIFDWTDFEEIFLYSEEVKK